MEWISKANGMLKLNTLELATMFETQTFQFGGVPVREIVLTSTQDVDFKTEAYVAESMFNASLKMLDLAHGALQNALSVEEEGSQDDAET